MPPRDPSRPMRLVRAAGLAVLVSAATLAAGPAGAAQGDPAGGVDVVEVQGVIDPALAGYVRDVLARAEREGATVVLQIDSRGSYGDTALLLARDIRASRVPVVAWVGPASARAEGGAVLLVYASSLAAMAPGAGIGPSRPHDLGNPDGSPSSSAEIEELLLEMAPRAQATRDGVARLAREALPARTALAAGAVALVAPRLPGEPGVLGLLRDLDGRQVSTSSGTVSLRTVGTDRDPVEIRLHDLGPVRRILHAVSTPTAFYVLLVLGLWALALELTQPGIGMAGIGGVLALALAGYAVTVIPVGWVGLALLLAGTALQGLDVLVRRLGVLTFAGTAAFAVGSALAWRGVAPAIDLSPWLIGFATAGGFLLFGFGLTVALRARERIRSQQIGLVGLMGEARGDLDPEGAVYVKGTLWRARTMDGKIPKGTRVRVRGVDGLILRVEQEPESD